MNNIPLSKSTYIRGLQCEKSLYLYKHFYHLKDPIDPQLQAIFDQGHEVGILAQKLFPNGVDASPESYYNMRESVIKTKSFIDNGESVIYEATFEFDGVIAALDILVKDNEGWKAYEVKSSTSVSETYLNDAAIQYYTIINSGVELMDISIVYINNQYVKNGGIDVHELFTITSVYDEVQQLLPNIPNKIEQFKNVIGNNSVPKIDIGEHCSKPYGCDFRGHCWKHVPEYSVFDISNLGTNKKFDLYNNGIVTFNQIDLENNPLNQNQFLQVVSELNQSSYIDYENISHFLRDLKYPLYFLDFETIGTAIPIYDGSRPYQQLPFQYSLHIQHIKDGDLTHYEYLAKPTTNEDPRIDFVKKLVNDCGDSGDIIVYNIGFEKGKLNDLMALYPQFSSEISNIIDRLKDLMIPFKNKWYYTPAMKGSYSIKSVLPALVPELSYQDLEIKEGGTASNLFLQIVKGEFNGDIDKTKKELLEYCKMDTYAMVKILEVLYKS
ncbi:DUF2779 domain-containing protein [Yeosuana sp. MJ-SS3]|uniref:DUF2779 domain-containing protein n=1 Tax=Gilvirhabdus luticola TaxID=3079858 RepID=A0ABU3U7D1_9FLAO|nr:DUF2779 domain-containing protein [Yeosuana sp. MJ-SS3]MDU8886308.1 DUF2779 domain-containing protein [Yeosuana sp. MJ-SS3]